MFELLVEYCQDLIEDNPIEAHRQSDGSIQVKDSGDSLIDRWEQQIADGEEPDLWESFAPEEQERIQQRLAKKRANAPRQSMKDVVESVERRAKSQGLNFSTFGGDTEIIE